MYRVLVCFLAAAFGAVCFVSWGGAAEVYSPQEVKAAEKRAAASPVYGEIKSGTSIFSQADEKSGSSVCEGRERVLIIRDIGLKWYYVEGKMGKGWVKAEGISIPSDPLTSNDVLSDREIECYINSKGFESKTNVFIWVDIFRQQVYVLKGTKGKFALERRIICATGRNVSPTIRGLFETSDKGEWFYSKRLESGAKYWVRFEGAYMFHSVAMDKDGNVTDPILGVRRSSGCVRMSLNDAKYIYNTAERGTAVFVN